MAIDSPCLKDDVLTETRQIAETTRRPREVAAAYNRAPANDADCNSAPFTVFSAIKTVMRDASDILEYIRRATRVSLLP